MMFKELSWKKINCYVFYVDFLNFKIKLIYKVSFKNLN